MTSIALNLTPGSPTFGDSILSAGDFQLVTSTTEILQNILQTLKVFLGEWFLDSNLGVDYYGTVLVKNPNQQSIDAIFISQILTVPGVTQLNSYSFTPDYVTRRLKIAFSVLTTTGIVKYSGLV